MVGWLRSVIAIACVWSVAVCASAGSNAAAALDVAGTIPLLAPLTFPSLERDTPPAVRERVIREQQAFAKAAREAARLPRTAAAGCKRVSGARFGPPAPVITPRILGHHVEVVFSFPSMPRSPACRPAILDVVVYSGRKASPSYNNAGGVGHYLLREPRGRVVLDVPWFGRPPYRVSVNSTTAAGVRGRTVERRLRCPGTGHLVEGCLRGYRPGAHSWPMPAPVLPLSGVDVPSLEASLGYVLAAERSAPLAIGSNCTTLQLCEVTFVDPSFPRSHYRVRYRIAGEQIAGCWMAMKGAIVDELPYADASTGRQQLAACVSWLR